MIGDDILTEEELCGIAAAGNRPALINWLQEYRIPFVLAKSGWPRVHRKALAHAMGVRDEKSIETRAAVDFNFDSLR